MCSVAVHCRGVGVGVGVVGGSNLLVTSSVPLPVHGTEPRDDDADNNLCLAACAAAAPTPASRSSDPTAARPGLTRPGHHAHHFGVAHLEVAGAVGGGLRADLRVHAAQLVPSPPINAKEREVVGGRVERHCGEAGLWKFVGYRSRFWSVCRTYFGLLLGLYCGRTEVGVFGICVGAGTRLAGKYRLTAPSSLAISWEEES